MPSGYRLLVHKRDRRTRDGWKLVLIKDYPSFSAHAMQDELYSLSRSVYKAADGFALDFEPMTRWVKNAMTGEMIEIDYRTPYCADPSSDSYWSA